MQYANAVSVGTILQPRLICQHCDHDRAAHVPTSGDVGYCVMDCDCLASPDDYAAFETDNSNEEINA